jgi:hypothetical protein
MQKNVYPHSPGVSKILLAQMEACFGGNNLMEE